MIKELGCSLGRVPRLSNRSLLLDPPTKKLGLGAIRPMEGNTVGQTTLHPTEDNNYPVSQVFDYYANPSYLITTI